MDNPTPSRNRQRKRQHRRGIRLDHGKRPHASMVWIMVGALVVGGGIVATISATHTAATTTAPGSAEVGRMVGTVERLLSQWRDSETQTANNPQGLRIYNVQSWAIRRHTMTSTGGVVYAFVKSARKDTGQVVEVNWQFVMEKRGADWVLQSMDLVDE